MNKDEGLIPKHGGYRNLRSFQSAQLVYDATILFCEKFIDKKSRTHDQMVQAARSGVQNIAEGSAASATSKKTEIKLTGVAKASLEELLLDYEDFLRQKGLKIWDKNSYQSLDIRERYKMIKPQRYERGRGSETPYSSDRSDQSDQSDKSDGSDKVNKQDLLSLYGLRGASAEAAANIIICLINQAAFLLKRQIQNLEQSFLNEGGFTEKMYHQRIQKRNQR